MQTPIRLTTFLIGSLLLIYQQVVQAEGSFITSEIWIKAEIQTEEQGILEAVWREGGESTTARGDKVIWGLFYANPNDVSWGNKENPELFVKVWFDTSGRIDVNFFHVSVPDIQVYSMKNGGELLFATTTLTKRYARHYFESNGQQGTVTENTDQPYNVVRTKYNPTQIEEAPDVSMGVLIDTVEKGEIFAIMEPGGFGYSQRGDVVTWGHFYVAPKDVSWGNPDNPEVFYKLWFDVSGRIDANFFHVSVPDVTVGSQLIEFGDIEKSYTELKFSVINTKFRYARHEYYFE